MKEYCLDLKLAKELKENGFPQKSCWSYYSGEDIVGLELSDHNFDCEIKISMSISDEILKELPRNIDKYWLTMCPDDISDTWGVMYGINPNFEYFQDKKLSNALAKMWLYLKKEGYIK